MPAEGVAAEVGTLLAEGERLFAAGAPARAAALFEQALIQAPHSAEAHCNLGAVSWAVGRADQALEHFRRALELDPDHLESALNLARLLMISGRVEEARHGAQAFLARHPEAAALRDLLADAVPAPERERCTSKRLRVGVFSTDPRTWAFPQLRLIAPLGTLSDEVELLWARRGSDAQASFDGKAIERSDVIVVQRLFPSEETLPLCRSILSSGRRVLYDLDDDFIGMPRSHPRYGVLRRFVPYVLEFLSRADVVSVSTQALAERIRPYNPNVHVLPNALDSALWKGLTARPRPAHPKGVVIGFAGTPTHQADLEIVAGALRRIRAEHGERVTFRFFGCAPPGMDRDCDVLPFEPRYNAYAKALACSDIDIALAPLLDTPFNRCKSDIKWLEYAVCGFAGVYSDLCVYRESVSDGQTGLLAANTEEAWFEAIDRLVRDAALRQRIGRAARAEALASRTLESVSERYRALYRQVERPPATETPGEGRLQLTAEYEIWKRRHSLTEARRRLWAQRSGATAPPVHLLVFAHAADRDRLAATLDSLERQIAPPASILVLGEGVRPQWLQRDVGYHGGEAGAPADAIRAFVQEVGDEAWVGLVEAGDRLSDEALAACRSYAAYNPGWQVIYSDEDFIDGGELRAEPLFKPAFNPDLSRASAYTGNFCLARAWLLRDAASSAACLPVLAHALVLRAWESNGVAGIGHVSLVLYHRSTVNARGADDPAVHTASRAELVAHLTRSGESATVEDGPYGGSWTVRHHHAEQPRVSIIVPTRDNATMLEDCIESILKRTAYPNYEILLVDNGSRESAALDYLEALGRREDAVERVRVIRYPHPYNYSAINNYAARLASGSVLVLLNNDTIVLQEDWIDRMLEHGLRSGIGAVGARLVFMDQTVQHAGVVVGLSGAAHHIAYEQPVSAPGYMARAQLDQNYSAVTAACLMVRADRYWEVGGLDEGEFKVLFNDVDLCLKLQRAGYRNLWTPRVTLVHHGSASLSDKKKLQRARAETEALWAAWLPELAGDPAHNRNLSLATTDWGIETALDVPWEADLPGPSRVLGFGAGSEGVLQHRVRIPLDALDRSGDAQCAIVPTCAGRARVPTLVELVRSGADTVLMHNAVHDLQLEALRDYSRYSQVFRVFGQDDLMTALPKKNRLSQEVYRDIETRLRLALSHCDRLVVTTEPLAQAYRDMIDDIRVVPNYLSRAVWGSLRSARRRGRKPRVGWAGAQQHAGDLEILREVVKQTADEVDWVFFGMSLHEFRRYRKELHDAVSFEEYPRTLAGLDLDLAVAPLECNRFNEAKSSLRILEYGALGWPVVCTDIEPYRGAPVCRVPNRPRAWIEAIRARVHDLDAAAAEGDRLRAWVHGGWMLEDHLQDWLEALRPDAGTPPGTP